MSSIAANLERVEAAVARACRAAGRARSEVEVMAVSKTHPVSCLLEAAAAGHLVFGENRVQEFAVKREQLAERNYTVELHARSTPPPGTSTLRVSLIGHLQSNKSARAAEIFTSIDTLDSLKLAERLQEAAVRGRRKLPVLIEVKLSKEPAKEGIAPESQELAVLLERLPDLDHILAKGLMTVAPIAQDPEVAQSCFRSLRLLRETIARRHPRLSLSELSMGMSGDFAEAIAEGSTQIRIGTAIFGARPRPAERLH